jgi:hypothetical protein
MRYNFSVPTRQRENIYVNGVSLLLDKENLSDYEKQMNVEASPDFIKRERVSGMSYRFGGAKDRISLHICDYTKATELPVFVVSAIAFSDDVSRIMLDEFMQITLSEETDDIGATRFDYHMSEELEWMAGEAKRFLGEVL